MRPLYGNFAVIPYLISERFQNDRRGPVTGNRPAPQENFGRRAVPQPTARLERKFATSLRNRLERPAPVAGALRGAGHLAHNPADRSGMLLGRRSDGVRGLLGGRDRCRAYSSEFSRIEGGIFVRDRRF